MKIAAKCIALYAPVSGTLVLAWWRLMIRGPIADAPYIVLWMVSLSTAAVSVILIPTFINGYFEPLRKQRVVFTGVGLVFLIGLMLHATIALSEL